VNTTELERTVNHSFKNKELLKTALTHRSYLNEHSSYKNPSNERLEFLGDAVLQFLISEYLYQNYPTSPEGMLTNFRAATVCAPALAAESGRLNFGQYLLLSKGEEASGGRQKEYILANTFEAILGALYLDSQDLDFCRRYLTKNLFYKIRELVSAEKYKDAKSQFQELSQEKRSITPSYKVLKEWGLDHDRQFLVGVYLKKELVAEGQGPSKQKAEQAAAEKALASWEEIG
jgi:ribonuclease-3